MVQQYCLICHKDIRKQGSIEQMIYSDDVICELCRSELICQPVAIQLEGVCGTGLYRYQGKMKELIIQYKELYDEALFPLFYWQQKHWIERKYKGYSIVCVPSTARSIAERGFRHVDRMVSILDLPKSDVLMKQGDTLQKKMSYQQRKNVRETISLRYTPQLGKVLIVDDILTTGQTMKACYDLLRPYCQKVEFLVLAYANSEIINIISKTVYKYDI